MARITEKEIHGVMTEVIEMDAPADELEDALRAQIAAEQAIESAETAQDAAERAEEAALRAEGNIAGVSSFNGRYGAVKPQTGDYTAKDVGALPLTGGTLSGDINGGYGVQFKSGNGCFVGWGDRTRIGINNMTLNVTYGENSPLVDAVSIIDEGASAYYKIFGEHNKPTGSYTGNGSATPRTISISGVGFGLLVEGYGNSGIITRNGGLLFNYNTTTCIRLKSSQINFADGVLTISCSDDAVNANGQQYYYQFI